MEIGKHTIELKPIKVDSSIKLDMDKSGKKELYVNKLGEPLEKIQIQKGEFKYVNEKTGKEETTKPYKAINGKAVNSFSKTRVVAKYDTIKLNEQSNFIENEKTYLVSGDSFKQELKTLAEKGECVTFKYANSGFKLYKAVAYFDLELGRVFLRCYRGDLRKIDLNETTTTKEIQAEEVDRIDINDIEV
jgi:hypothetical protein